MQVEEQVEREEDMKVAKEAEEEKVDLVEADTKKVEYFTE